MQALLDAFEDKYVCAAHNWLHLSFVGGASLTNEALTELVGTLVGNDASRYQISLNEDGFNSLKDSYSGQGDGDSAGAEITITLTSIANPEEKVDLTVNFWVRKNLSLEAPRAIPCPEDDIAAMNQLVADLTELVPCKDGRPYIQFMGSSTVTIENLNNLILPKLGLKVGEYTLVIPDSQLTDQSAYGGIGDGEECIVDFEIGLHSNLTGKDGDKLVIPFTLLKNLDGGPIGFVDELPAPTSTSEG